MTPEAVLMHVAYNGFAEVYIMLTKHSDLSWIKRRMCSAWAENRINQV